MMPWCKVEVFLEVIDGVVGASSSWCVFGQLVLTMVGLGLIHRNKTLKRISTKFHGWLACLHSFYNTTNLRVLGNRLASLRGQCKFFNVAELHIFNSTWYLCITHMSVMQCSYFTWDTRQLLYIIHISLLQTQHIQSQEVTISTTTKGNTPITGYLRMPKIDPKKISTKISNRYELS